MKNQSIRAIETRYKGYRFRSRLEARWAVFFDALGIKWEYEAEGYKLPDGSWYLPDFWLPEVIVWETFVTGAFAEVKPRDGLADLRKPKGLAMAQDYPVIVLDGAPARKDYSVFGHFWEGPGGELAEEKCRYSGLKHGNPRFVPSDEATPKLFGRRWAEAVTVAREARFEHGESGAAK